MRRPIIGVIGGNGVDEQTQHAAEALGANVARQYAILLTGGQPTGPSDVKRAAMRGALRAMGVNARLIGILPADEVFRQHEHWNNDTQRFIQTRLSGAERNPINALTPDAMFVLAGKAGTLAELGFALAANKPIFFSKGSFDALRATFQVNAEERNKLRRLLIEGTPKYVELSRKGLTSDIENDLLAHLFRDETEITEGLPHANDFIQATIDGLGHAYRFMDSQFPGLHGVLTKAEFEEWLCKIP